MKINYEDVGLRVGLEIHQQLDTAHKLFCKCPARLSDKEEKSIHRYLRAVKSELGEVDPAALFEVKRGRSYVYLADTSVTCLVEMDEEPPHNINMEAVKIALTVALMLKSRPVDEIHVMRKEVIDGSNTTGFQRTAIIATGGILEDDEDRIGIQTICLEEDAARKIKEEGNLVYYRLDRLGIPLIEIATEPEIRTPDQARRVALKIGRILRATGKVKRGIGTIRQDLNISIKNGAKTEIKGVQELDLIPKVIEYEVLRQLKFLELKELLWKRLRPEDLEFKVIDVTDLFKSTKSRVILKGIKRGHRVYALKLSNMAGLLKFEVQPGRRFGTELSDYAMFWGGITGIIHTDELPGYGITESDVKKLKSAINADEKDAIIIAVGPRERCEEGLRAVYDRVLMAFSGVPEETRNARPDGTTSYSRPRPGSARMYPETDIPPLVVTNELIKEIEKNLPKTLEEKVKELVKNYKINKELAEAIVDSPYYDIYIKAVKMGVQPSVVAVVLTQTLKSLHREGLPVENLTDKILEEVFMYVSRGELVKEALEDVLAWLSKNPGKGVKDAIRALKIETLTREEVEALIEKIIEQNREKISSMGIKALGLVMKILMSQIRGRYDGGKAKELVEEKLRLFRNDEPS